jgi:hypothetical protein
MEERCGQVGIEFKFPPRDRMVTFVFSLFLFYTDSGSNNTSV